MIIVYAAVAGQSVVKLYAAAMFPGFFLALLYVIYVIGWVMLNPKIAPKLPLDQQRAPISPWVAHVSASYSPRMLPALGLAVLSPARALRGAGQALNLSWFQLLRALMRALVPVWLALVCLGATWWYVTIYSQKLEDAGPARMQQAAPDSKRHQGGGLQEPPSAGGLQEPPGSSGLQEPPGSDSLAEPPGAAADPRSAAPASETLQQMGGEESVAPKAPGVPDNFYLGFGIAVALTLGLLIWYYLKFDAEQFEILTMLVTSVMPLATLTLVVLGVILFGITTATESAAVGAAGAFLMAFHARTLNFQRIKEAVFLTVKTTSMVCWLFVGSALFSAVFALLGGQRLVEEWVLSMNLTPLQFMLLSQAIIFVLGWPLEWTEIIVIFVPIFLPLLAHFQIDPLLWGVLVFVNLQAAFLSPPVAMSAFYLKGVSPSHVTINQIFAGMMPYMAIVVVCMAFMYIWPGLTLWLPRFLYGG
jgi:TRAP-type mannitol/chloroaromatic compound transport system permease large subunit